MALVVLLPWSVEWVFGGRWLGNVRFFYIKIYVFLAQWSNALCMDVVLTRVKLETT